MSLTQEAHKWHDVYEQLSRPVQDAIDKAFEAVILELSQCTTGKFATDDRAEELVAAITKFYWDSGRR